MENSDLQQQFFTFLKGQLPAHLSMVDELSDLLDISADSIYRRIRGEKPITLPELKAICEHYKLSLDQMLQLHNESVIFHAPEINGQGKDFTAYLKGLLAHLKHFNSFNRKKMLYFCKDMTFFHFYIFPEIAAFKTFFWIKTIKNDPAFSNAIFSLEDFSMEESFSIGQELVKEYNNIPSLELWNLESINSTISQIQYYRDSGTFKYAKDLALVVDSLQHSLDHIQHQAEKGVKFMPGATDVSHKAPLQFYVNEVVLGSNTILLELNETRLSFITYSVLNYIITKDHRFNEKVFDNFYNLLTRSTLISGTGEKERNRFFNNLRAKVQALKA